MEQTAKVISCENGIAKVEVKRTSACGENCASCKAGCPSSNIYVDAVNKVNAKPFQYVCIEMKSKILALALGLNYILPMFMLFIGIVAGYRLFNSSFYGNKAELYALLLGLALMAAAFLAVSHADRMFGKRNKVLFTITKILH